MIIKPITTHISRTLIESGLWHIEKYLRRYGVDQAAQDMAPLIWYIETGRASVDFIRGVILESKPYMIGRKLHEGGSYDEVILRLTKYLSL